MGPKLRTENLGRRADGRAIVESVTLEIEAGGRVGLVGPSGSGKTALLRLLNRIDEPTEGTVYVDGRDYREIDPVDLRARIGLVPQQPALLDATVVANVTAGPRLRGEPVDRERALDLLERVDLRETADRAVASLSGGEAARVSLARTLFAEPDALLVDEPAASLDETTARLVEALLDEVIERRELTAVVVSHDVERARRLTDRLLEVESGRLSCGTPSSHSEDEG
ncbi:MAG: ATP-binding cassette domain-containing protein [Bradymonadaceae bacterium]